MNENAFSMASIQGRTWFGVKLRFAISIDNYDFREFEDRVFIFSCSDISAALEHALGIGKSREHEYANADGNLVRHQLVEVVGLKTIFLDRGDKDEFEVYYEAIPADSSFVYHDSLEVKISEEIKKAL
ncbi:MAG TPA: DUF4288 domain-containing protein [Bryobacteraceae bacterium]|nr:DUF4288 domain-containing protein [Bryobacteraceae bacterium]